MPWFGPLGSLSWNASIWLTEWARLRKEPWWWDLRRALKQEFADLDPHQLVQRLRGKQHIGSLAFGETPCLSVLKILETAQLEAGARLVDLGSGRGLPCLTASARGFPSLGLEYFAVYTERSTRIAKSLELPATFLSGNLLSRPLPPAQLYLISATAFPESFRAQLQQHLHQAPSNCWIVTQDWILDPPFVVTRMQQLPVSWGVARFVYHQKPPFSPP